MESAILLAVPEAEPLVGAWRDKGDPVARPGIPAHVTLLHPFVPDPDVGVVEELRWFFAGVDAFPLTFSRVDSFGGDVTFLAPDQAEDCRQLTLALARRWPDVPPRELAGTTPHLTVVSGAYPDLHASARASLTDALPVRSRAAQASLYVQGPDGCWLRRACFPLGD